MTGVQVETSGERISGASRVSQMELMGVYIIYCIDNT